MFAKKIEPEALKRFHHPGTDMWFYTIEIWQSVNLRLRIWQGCSDPQEDKFIVEHEYDNYTFTTAEEQVAAAHDGGLSWIEEKLKAMNQRQERADQLKKIVNNSDWMVLERLKK